MGWVRQAGWQGRRANKVGGLDQAGGLTKQAGQQGRLAGSGRLADKVDKAGGPGKQVSLL